jgi:hypothetical protein
VAWGDEDELVWGAGVEGWSGEGGHLVFSGGLVRRCGDGDVVLVVFEYASVVLMES